MKSIKKLAAATTALTLVATNVGCGKSTSIGLTIDDYEVRAGIFIFYTMNAYYDASQIVAENEGLETVDIEQVKNAHIDDITSTEWIQNKAVEYCSEFVALQKEFEALNGEFTATETAEIQDMYEYYQSSTNYYSDNGIGEESLYELMELDYKRNFIFNYYYGIDSENGKNETELQEYFDDSYARVKYITIDLTDSEGEALKGDDKIERIDMANDYAEQIEACDTVQDKLYKMNDLLTEYDEYIADLEAEELEEETTTTTTTTVEEDVETTTTTTNPYANEKIIPKITEVTTDASADVVVDDAVTTTTQEVTYTPSKAAHDYIFYTAVEDEVGVVEDTDAVYVILRTDLYERMTEDDVWTEDVMSNLQSELYADDFNDFIQEILADYSIEKNSKSFKRYEPFSLKYGE